jgi:urea transport system substrate-binding protein
MTDASNPASVAAFLRIAVDKGLIDREAAEAAAAEAERTKTSAVDLLQRQGLLSSFQVRQVRMEVERASGPPTIAGHRVVATLGRGGMGVVYKAMQKGFEREIALKVMHGHLARDPAFSERFLREAQASGRINHPHVVTVYETGRDGDGLYLAMEFVAGGDAEHLRQACGGRLTPRRAVEIVRDAARGLAAIHKAGLVHRDIKPSNIFVTAEGSAKLADLGLARHADGDDRLTLSGQILGTPAFMSPEQAGGGHIDIRTDIYALGATLYTLVTGSQPYHGTTAMAIAVMAANGPFPDPLGSMPLLPRTVAAVIRRATAKPAADRHQTPAELVADLDRALADPAVGAEDAPAMASGVGAVPAVSLFTAQAPIAGATASGGFVTGGAATPATAGLQPLSIDAGSTGKTVVPPAPAAASAWGPATAATAAPGSPQPAPAGARPAPAFASAATPPAAAASPAQAPRRSHWTPVLVAVVPVLALLGAGGWWWQQTRLDAARDALLARIPALPDAAPADAVSALATEVADYDRGADAGRRAAVDAAWQRKHEAILDAARATILARIAALPAGADETAEGQIASAVQDYGRTATVDRKATVDAAWAKQRSALIQARAADLLSQIQALPVDAPAERFAALQARAEHLEQAGADQGALAHALGQYQARLADIAKESAARQAAAAAAQARRDAELTTRIAALTAAMDADQDVRQRADAQAQALKAEVLPAGLQEYQRQRDAAWDAYVAWLGNDPTTVAVSAAVGSARDLKARDPDAAAAALATAEPAAQGWSDARAAAQRRLYASPVVDWCWERLATTGDPAALQRSRTDVPGFATLVAPHVAALRQQLAVLDQAVAIPDGADGQLRTLAAAVDPGDADLARWQAKVTKVAQLGPSAARLDAPGPLTVADREAAAKALDGLVALIGADAAQAASRQQRVDGHRAAESRLKAVIQPLLHADHPDHDAIEAGKSAVGEWLTLTGDDTQAQSWSQQIAKLDQPAPATGPPVRIGILHSLSGTMAFDETSLRDAVLMAVEEINARGGVLGHPLEPVVVDPASDWPLFAEKAKQLVTEDRVAVTFGCWTSVSRKSVLPVFEANDALLFYPLQFEGEEESRNVFYTGATPDEQFVPAAQFLMSAEGGGYRRFYLLGTDYVFPRVANKVLKAFLMQAGVPAENIAEEYVPFHHQDFQTVVGKIRAFSAGGKACVLSTLNGDSNVPFYQEFANQGMTAAFCPIVAFSLTEDDLRAMDVPPLVGHLAVQNYFQSIDTPGNRAFVQDFQDFCAKHKLPGGRDRVTSDPIEAAYSGVYAWKAACEKARSFDVDAVRAAASGLEFDAPGGHKKMDERNQHTWKPVYVGEIQRNGQFRIVWKSKGLVHPDAYSRLLHPDGNIPEPTGGPRN